ncbi:hypothetical protein EIP86_001456 [Pleurotus ostreatoroseus]|nr:hypothetical protein EIP86_001456 [Pleurotus ostreatoroseus]
MFSSAVQPPLVSLFSSTSSEPLGLFSTHVDHSLPADSFIALLDDTTSQPQPQSPAKLIASPQNHDDEESGEGYTLNQTVLHMQSPTIRTTYIRSPPVGTLGMKHPWIHLQVRNMEKEWSFEVGIVDRAGREDLCCKRDCSTQAIADPEDTMSYCFWCASLDSGTDELATERTSLKALQTTTTPPLSRISDLLLPPVDHLVYGHSELTYAFASFFFCVIAL